MRTHNALAAILLVPCSMLIAACVQGEDVQPETGEEENVGESSEESRWVVYCKNKDIVDCMIECNREGIPCEPTFKHPYKSGLGRGELFACAKVPRNTCAYKYNHTILNTCLVFPRTSFAPMCSVQ